MEFVASPQPDLCFRGGKLSWRNHLAQNLKVHFILYFITIKLMMRVHEEIQLSSLSHSQVAGGPMEVAPPTN